MVWKEFFGSTLFAVGCMSVLAAIALLYMWETEPLTKKRRLIMIAVAGTGIAGLLIGVAINPWAPL